MKFWNLLMVGMCLPVLAFAWGDLGHSAVGELAERNLGPEAKKMILDILGPEPLAVAATFPDQVRADDRYKGYDKFDSYHFVEVPTGHTYENRPSWSSAEKDANAFISQVPALLKDKNVPRARKMILLRYLIHVVGDVHQPLHVGNGLDMGANLCDVLWREPESGRLVKKNLHTIWDEGLIDVLKERSRRASPTTAKRYFSYQDLVKSVISDVKLEPGLQPKIVQSSPTSWYEESAKLRDTIYPDEPNNPVTDPTKRMYCKHVDPTTKKVVNGAYEESRLPEISEDYIDKSLPIIKRQILVGGLRLAEILNQAGKGYQGSSPEVESSEAILRGVQLKNPRKQLEVAPPPREKSAGGSSH